jgi:1-deoxy-D-xylulose-5-phosphate reductoisomerase
MPTTLNAANEIAVRSFLDGEIAFTAIPRIISSVMDVLRPTKLGSLEDVLAADGAARQAAEELVSAQAR